MQITIDKKIINVEDTTKNIVEIAAEHDIGIPAPCFKLKRKYGCCNGCVITIDGVKAYACTVKPQDGMVIEVNTEELIRERKVKLMTYKLAVKSGKKLPCDCGDGCSDDDCGCEGGC